MFFIIIFFSIIMEVEMCIVSIELRRHKSKCSLRHTQTCTYREKHAEHQHQHSSICNAVVLWSDSLFYNLMIYDLKRSFVLC